MVTGTSAATVAMAPEENHAIPRMACKFGRLTRQSRNPVQKHAKDLVHREWEQSIVNGLLGTKWSVEEFSLPEKRACQA